MAHDKGKEAMSTAFIRRRLTTNVISFHDPIPKLKLVTFDSMPVSSVKIGGSSVKIGGEKVMLKADRDFFARLLVVTQARDMDLYRQSSSIPYSSVVSGFSGWVLLQTC